MTKEFTGWVRSGTAAAVAFGLIACGSSGGESGTGGGAGVTGGFGGGAGVTGGIGGSAGVTGGVGGSAGVSGGVGGSAGVSGGTGGTAGNPVVCGGGADIRTGSQCDAQSEGYFAIKTELDVWWQGVPTRDPGRGKIQIYLLGRLEEVCPDGSGGRGTIKSCGTRLPPFTSDVACDAFQIEFPDEIWESPTMPRFTTTGNVTAFAPGGILTLDPAIGLVGIDLVNGQEAGTWPGAKMIPSINCEAGSGVACFPDHDNDGHPGVTIRIKSDETTYTYANVDQGGIERAQSDTHYGKCTNMGIEYKHRGAPTGLNLSAGGGGGGGVRAGNVRIGLRTRLGGAGAIANTCDRGVGASTADMLDSRALDCIVTPQSLPPGGGLFDPPRDARLDSQNYNCSAAEADFVDENVPIYRVLQSGDVPGDSGRPNGWLLAGREIDKRPSRGARSALIRLAGLNDAEPTCASVRNANYPADP